MLYLFSSATPDVTVDLVGPLSLTINGSAAVTALKVGDTRAVRCMVADSRGPVDLTGVVLLVHVAPATIGFPAAPISGMGTPDPDQTDHKGEFTTSVFKPIALPGPYRAEVAISYPSGVRVVAPDDDYANIIMLASLLGP